MKTHNTDILVIGAGIIGIATAYFIKKINPDRRVTIIDQLQPMSFTSAQSGENYRNWWSHPTMKEFIEHSIQLMEDIALETNERINITRRGYVLATRKNDISALVFDLEKFYPDADGCSIRHHTQSNSKHYQPAISEDWKEAPKGVDVLESEQLIKKHFPYFDPEIENIIHIRLAGMLDSQQLAAFMLQGFKLNGGIKLTGKVMSIENNDHFTVQLDGEKSSIATSQIINAAGPFIADIAKMLDVDIPVENTLQQKIAFPDKLNAVPRTQPFSIDLDAQEIDWSADEKSLLSQDADFEWLTKELSGAIHCRPEGGDHGQWVKLGWAFNTDVVSASMEPVLEEYFPEIVVHGAARLNPALKGYYKGLPANTVHYGGYYTATEENWPLIGKTNVEGFFINGAMSGFGTMAACAAGELCAQWVLEKPLPSFADELSLARYKDKAFIQQLRTYDKGLL